MSDVVYTTAQIAVICGKMRWDLERDTEGGRIGRGVLRRSIKHDDLLTKAQWDQVRSFLKTYTDVTNYAPTEQVPTPPACATVASPYAERESVSGTWHGGPIDIFRDPDSGRWKLIQTLFLQASFTDTAYISEDGLRYRMYRTFYVDLAAPPTFSPAKSDGVDWTSGFSIDPDTGLYSGWTEKRTALAWTLASYIAETDDFLVTTRDGGGNQASIPNATAGQRVEGERNETGLYDFRRVTETPVNGLVGTSETYTLLGGFEDITIYTEWNLASPIYPDGHAVWYYRYPSSIRVYRVKYVHTLTYYATRAAAIVGIDGGFEGSRFERISTGLWLGIKITRNDKLISTTNLPDPYDALH